MRYIYLCFVLCLAYVLFNSHSSGAGAVQQRDRTGSPLGSGSCANCHIGGIFNTEVEAKLLKDTMEVQSYTPGETYTFQISINTVGNPSRYGFQAVALSGEDNIDAGSFENLPSGTKVTDLEGRSYFEHSTKLPEPVIEADWVAPEAGTGDVRFYVAGNAVNNAAGSSGDTPDLLDLPLTIRESQVSSVDQLDRLDINWTLYPNPVRNQLNIKVNMVKRNRYHLRLIDQQNRLIRSQVVDLNVGENQLGWDIEILPKGLYYMQLFHAESLSTRKFLKL